MGLDVVPRQAVELRVAEERAESRIVVLQRLHHADLIHVAIQLEPLLGGKSRGGKDVRGDVGRRRRDGRSDGAHHPCLQVAHHATSSARSRYPAAFCASAYTTSNSGMS